MIESVWYAICDLCERELGPYYTREDAVDSVTGLGWLLESGDSLTCVVCVDDREE